MSFILEEKISAAEIKILSILLDEKYNIITLTELHGFLTAVLSSPILVKPSDWLPYVLQDEEGNEHCFDNLEDFQELSTLIFKFYNSIIAELNNNEDFKIVSFKHGKYINTKKASDEELEYWCSSYISGTYYGKWSNDESIAMLMPFAVLAKEFDIDKYKDDPKEDIDIKTKFKNELSNYILFLYCINNDERLSNAPKNKKPKKIKDHIKIGRNNSCPCGSGKKYKKCCSNQQMAYH